VSYPAFRAYLLLFVRFLGTQLTPGNQTHSALLCPAPPSCCTLPAPCSGICAIGRGIDASVVYMILLWQHCRDRHELRRPTRFMPPFAQSLFRPAFGSANCTGLASRRTSIIVVRLDSNWAPRPRTGNRTTTARAEPARSPWYGCASSPVRWTTLVVEMGFPAVGAFPRTASCCPSLPLTGRLAARDCLKSSAAVSGGGQNEEKTGRGVTQGKDASGS